MAMTPYLTTPFHDRIAPLCETDAWQRWEGYTTVATVTALDEGVMDGDGRNARHLVLGGPAAE